MTEAAISMRNVAKSFTGVTVLRDVNLSVLPGEVHGLVGENGSGKSTLVKILGGIHVPDHGSRITLQGEEVTFPIKDVRQHGVAIIHQDLALVEGMSVADNVGISTGYERWIGSPISSRHERTIIRDLAKRFGLDLDPNQLVGDLSPAERSVVAILRGLRQLGDDGQNKVIVLDEPTAALPHAESIRLLELLRTMARNGTAVIYISHRMNEVLSVCDRISVLRSGQLVATVDAAAATASQIVDLMLGYPIGEFYPEKHVHTNQDVRLQVRSLTHGGITDLSFEAHAGEIVGVTGLAGMGQDEIPYLLAGGRARLAGEVVVDGRPVDGSPRSARLAGMGLVPGNRQRDALWLLGSASENLTLPHLGKFWRKFRIHPAREREFVEREFKGFSVSPTLPSLEISHFSGGNQQKIVMSRILRLEPGVLLLHEPSQGVDAGAKKEILNIVRAAADAGAAVVIFSSDTEEVAQVCHRVLIMQYGSSSAMLSPGEVSDERILSLSQRGLSDGQGGSNAA